MNLDLKNLHEYTVKIFLANGDSIIGTGFFFHPDGYILTCYHVIDPSLSTDKEHQLTENFQILFNNQTEKIDVDILYNYSLKENDIAVLKIRKKTLKVPFLPLEIYNERWHIISEKFASFGYPRGQFKDHGILVSGNISGSTKIDNLPVFHIEGFSVRELSRGYSGSPVVCARTKKVIGLINATYIERDNVAFFIPISKMIIYWKQCWREIIDFHDVYRRIREEIQFELNGYLTEKLKDSPFIPLHLQRGDIKEKKEKEDDIFDFFLKKTRKKIKRIREWHNFPISELQPLTGSYLLSADVGCGKTTFLFWLARENNTNFGYLALFIECSKFAEWKSDSWEDLKQKISNHFQPTLKKNPANNPFINDEDVKDCLDFFFQNEKIIFFYDGLDQIPGQTLDYSRIVKSIFRIAGLNKTIISSRPSALISYADDPSFSFLRLMKFSKDDEKIYFGEYYKIVNPVRALSPELKSIPMLAFMIKTLAIKGSISEIKNRADLYEKFMDHILTQQNRITLDGQGIKVREELERISYESLNSKDPAIQIIPLEAKYVNKDSISMVLSYGLVNFILEDGKQFLFFTHTSFQEYFAARFIEKSDQSREIIKRIISEEESIRWQETIRFLTGILGNMIISELLLQKKHPEKPLYSVSRKGYLIFQSLQNLE